MNKKILAALAAASLFPPGMAGADNGAGGPNFSFYGSLRIHSEHVRPDNRDEAAGGLDSYSALRDAYSRLGVTADWALNPGLEVFGQLELPVDTANLKIQDPYDQGGFGRSDEENVRVALIGLRSDFGTLQFGQQWMPYYNAISYPVDMFSTYYSGFATYAVFRVRDTVAYYSPDFHGLSFAASYSDKRGNVKSTSRIDDSRTQLTATYSFGDTTVSAGLDDRGSPVGDRDRIWGLAAAHQLGDLYLAAKYERFDSDNDSPGAFNRDGNEAFNVFASYTRDKNTFKIMLADVENYGDTVVHLGVDHRVNDALTLFAEYYYEESTAAITTKRGGLGDFPAGANGGQVLAAGLRYDF
ncbi:Porin, Gram-negative type [Thioalkalivibrio nitratireducens DSM 14787]|uniref:Porin, Gram-negative type n=1 Tax=Thioalkalivibrio nitratireducens (strain DSM 14787 / UNIQEM 213 / ALEN2) TaxID=1255043 RepID=L0E283_THIND|nr:porin [Thioalkalivibrio nitratireducens]AGA35383.1 Porin, Gram-negative type [Thioalkalivibrio nitratireducens DSM 14787]